jgi:hypothetical protein
MTIQFRAIHSVLLAIVFILCGCSAAFDLAITGAGQAAKVENIKFFTSTTELKPRSRADLPDYYYVSSNYSSSKYKIVIINDFTSITSDISHISGLQVPAFKNLRVDIPDNIAQSLDGSVFSKCIRSSKRIDHLDINDIKRCKGDAILFGNISRIRSGLRAKDGHVGLTNTQVEIKIVDRKTGEETIKMIMRNSTDGDKVIMPIVRQLSNLINVAENERHGNKEMKDSPSEQSSELKPASATVTADVRYITVKTKTSIRERDDKNSKVIRTAKIGEKLKIIDESSEWFKVQIEEDKGGWILKSKVKKN